ncbi:MAG: tyrosine-protein phosphatase [Saprospiraceae bacterium]
MPNHSTSSLAFLLLSVIAICCTSCGPKVTLDAPEVTPETRINLVRQASGDYLLKTNEGGVQPIYVGTRPTNIDWSTPYGQRQGRRTVISNPGLADRYFIGMHTENGDTLIVSDQRIPLSGSNNFRDVGGIPTKDGRFVRWGQIYRSDRLSALTDKDLKYLESLGLKTVYDFRSETEVAEDPNILPQIEGLDYINEPIYFDVEDTTNVRERILSGEMSTVEAGDILVEGNRLFATEMSQRFKPFVDCLLGGKGPIVYHCTSGKDRTGFATLLLLSAINVGRDTIVEDYLLSNYYRYEMNQDRLKKLRYASIIKRNLNIETIAPLMIVDRRYINAAYDAIEEKYGNVDTFLEKEYGLDADKRAELIDMYTYGPAVVVDGEFVPAETGDLEDGGEKE